MEKVSLNDFKRVPRDGVLIREQNALSLTAGLKQGGLIVAIDQVRVHDFSQYLFVRKALTGPEMDLIVWQENAFKEIKASPPDHRFGVKMETSPAGKR